MPYYIEFMYGDKCLKGCVSQAIVADDYVRIGVLTIPVALVKSGPTYRAHVMPSEYLNLGWLGDPKNLLDRIVKPKRAKRRSYKST